MAQMLWFQGQQDAVFPHLHAAEALVEGAEPSPGVTRVLAWSARYQMLGGDNANGLRHAQEHSRWQIGFVSTTCVSMR